MATRLYPQTRNREVLAQLAGVRADTWRELKLMRRVERALKHFTTEFDFDEGESLRFAAWQENQGTQIAILDNFLLCGWGRVDGAVLTSLGFDPYCGATDDLSLVTYLCRRHGVALCGVDVAALEGLTWT